MSPWSELLHSSRRRCAAFNGTAFLPRHPGSIAFSHVWTALYMEHMDTVTPKNFFGRCGWSKLQQHLGSGGDVQKSKSKNSETSKKIKKSTKVKDTNRPKRSLCSYMLFAADVREQVKTKLPDATAIEVAKEIANLWKQASANQKKKYEKQAKKDKEEYLQAMDQYNVGQ